MLSDHVHWDIHGIRLDMAYLCTQFDCSFGCSRDIKEDPNTKYV